MKSILSFTALVLSATSVLASPIQDQSNGVHQLAAPKFEGSAADKPSSCSSGFTITYTLPATTATPDPDFDFFTFCSAFMQPTYTVLKTTNVATTKTAVVATVTGGTKVTQTVGSGGTVTSLCPAPAQTSHVCGVQAWGYAANSIYFAQPLDPASCHQLCLENESCNSFQTQNSSYPSPQCSLYNTTASANNTIVGNAPFLFYDWDCPDYLPSQCKTVTATVITTHAIAGDAAHRAAERAAVAAPLPTAFVAAAALEDRAAAYATLPGFLAPFGSSSVTNVCNCIISSPSPAVLITKLTAVGTVVTVPATVTSYTVATVTVTAGAVTVVSTVT